MAPTDRQDRNDLRQLELQLTRIARKRLSEVFKKPGRGDEIEFPIVARIARAALPVTWREDRTRALIRLMGAVIDRLPDEMPEECTITWKEIGELLYGFRADLPGNADGTPLDYNDYVDIVRNATSQMSTRSFQRNITEALRKKLASLLLEVESDVISGAINLEATVTNGATTSTQPEPPDTNQDSTGMYDTDRTAPGLLDPALEQEFDRLAKDIRRELIDDRRWRRVNDPFPIPVRWSNAPEKFVDHWEKIRGVPRQVDSVNLAGNVASIATIFRSIPSQRLVILGEGGAGKTTLLAELALALLAPTRYRPGEPVPVIFDISSWDPLYQSLNRWLVDYLSEKYRNPRSSRTTWAAIAAILVNEGRILPLLDGFDEIAPNLRHVLLRALNTDLADTRLVLTSRPQEYFDAVESADAVVTRAAAVQMEPLTLDEIQHYLPLTSRKLSDSAENRTKWNPVLQCMVNASSGSNGAALQRSLSTPLMVSLAREIYSETSRDPAELINEAQFRDPTTISEHLLDQFIGVAYQSEASDPSKQQTRHTGQQAGEFLARLAVNLHARSVEDIAWWWLTELVPRKVFNFILALAVVFGVALGVIILPTVPLESAGTAYLLIAVAVAGLSIAVSSENGPRRLTRPKFRRWLGRDLLDLTPEYQVGLLLGGSAIVATAVEFSDGSFAGWGQGAGVTMLLALGYVYMSLTFTRRSDFTRSSSPRALLRSDALASIVRGLYCAAGMISFGLISGSASNAWLILVAALTVCAGTTLSGAAGALLITNLWLGRHMGIWRVMNFLEDARRRGVLRQAGAMYQFRHRMLKQRLAHTWIERYHQETQNEYILRARSSIASGWTTSGRADRAEPELFTVLEQQRTTLGQRHPDTLKTWFFWALALHWSGRHDRALEEMERLHATGELNLDPADKLTLGLAYFRGLLLIGSGHKEAGAAVLNPLLSLLEREGRGDDPIAVSARKLLSEA